MNTTSDKKIYAFDLDGTLCHTPGGNDYLNSTPIQYRINYVNQLARQGHTIIIFTARGCRSGLTPELQALTANQLKDWRITHHELIMGHKPHFDLLIDDKAVHVSRWERENPVGPPGIIAGSFDVMHPGYIEMFDDAIKVCSRLIVCLQERGKRPSFMSVEDRKMMLLSLKQVNEVIPYKTEADLLQVLKKNSPHVRILGEDYIDKDYTGMELHQDVYFINRKHGWSTTKLLQKIRGNRNRRNKELRYK